MASEIDLSTLDKRLVERLIKNGQLPAKEYDKHLKTLPDLADKAAPVETSFEPESAED